MKKNIVSVEHLSHKYSKNWAIRDINFEINQKGVLGLLGSNGAGKSTTMNILCGVLNQTEGKVFIDGINLREHPEQAKRLLGFLPQNAPLHLDLTVDEYLRYCAFIRNIEKKQVKAAVEAAKAKCGITHFSHRLISNLSGGYRQRVGIAQAIIHQPKLVVLDEPTNGLDPIQILEVRKLIREIAEERSVIFSTHILSEVQATCNDIRMIEGGRMVFADTMDAFNNYILPNSLLVSLDNPPALAELEAIEGVTSAELLNDNSIRIRFKASGTISKRIVELSINNGWQLSEILLEKSSLDEIFAQLSNRPLR
ncbi:ABC transporter ATP-binding protein [Mucilaginibacter sp. BJC16-A38]|uniref:ABC transporter ATP-binding protein n=1 Tax=Mucilaginibacter phenanthrenivorans TaxID=1234842 RepID=UPI00215786B3|nr:ABC transporter ATP-binding protein [Mucilaginibacter phenanthrenivorans]MCR8556547.1 ABC transporter ATP-binding protein [Mucilaginibacter phenanthrenivorans]